jgi:hypothetical protein
MRSWRAPWRRCRSDVVHISAPHRNSIGITRLFRGVLISRYICNSIARMFMTRRPHRPTIGRMWCAAAVVASIGLIMRRRLSL